MYGVILDQFAAGIIQQNSRTVYYGPDTWIKVVANGVRDEITLCVKGQKEEPKEVPRGFLVQMKNGDTRLYAFDFDANAFDYTVVDDLNGGTHRRRIGRSTETAVTADNDAEAVYVSWDGTGNGDVAIEVIAFPFPTYADKPFDKASSNLYSQGVSYEFLPNNSKIHGLGVDASGAVVAAEVVGSTITFHYGVVSMDETNAYVSAIGYGGVLGTCALDGSITAPVNFSSTLARAVCGLYLIDLPTDWSKGLPATLTARKLATLDVDTLTLWYRCVWSGFDPNDKPTFAVKRTTKKIDSNLYAPKGAGEVVAAQAGSGQTSASTATVGETWDYFEFPYVDGGAPTFDTPFVTGYRSDQQVSNVEYEPYIAFQGIFPTLMMRWARTTLRTTTTLHNTFYWYRDEVSKDYVRYAWDRSLVSTQQWGTGGFAGSSLNELDVLHVYAMNVNGQKTISGAGLANWYYAITDGYGDFLLRKELNGTKGDALLVSKKGLTLTVNDTLAVGII